MTMILMMTMIMLMRIITMMAMIIVMVMMAVVVMAFKMMYTILKILSTDGDRNYLERLMIDLNAQILQRSGNGQIMMIVMIMIMMMVITQMPILAKVIDPGDDDDYYLNVTWLKNCASFIYTKSKKSFKSHVD